MSDFIEPSSATPRPDADGFLEVFARGLNAHAAKGGSDSFPLTLWVGGSIVSGYLVGAATYYEGVKESFRGAADGDDVWDPLFDNLIASVRAEWSVDESEDDPPLHVVHLRNAQVYTPGQPPAPADGMWWRGRIESVDAFSFGRFSDKPS